MIHLSLTDVTFYKHSFFKSRTCTKSSFWFYQKTFPFNLKECFLNEGTKNYFQMVQNFLFLADSVVDHFFISYLQQDTFLPKEKKSI